MTQNYRISWKCATCLVVTGVLVTGCAAQTAEPDPANELPFGWMELPTQGATVPSGMLSVEGWALDDSAVREVRVYYDNKFKASIAPSVARSDLASVHPTYVHGSDQHGWRVAIEVANAPGTHTVLAQAVDDRGATRDLGTATITVR